MQPAVQCSTASPQGLGSLLVRVRVIAGRYGNDTRESAAARIHTQNPRQNLQVNLGDPPASGIALS